MPDVWLADGREPWPEWSPEMGEPVGVICWRPKSVADGELESIMQTTRIWLAECGYTLVALPTAWKRRQRAQPFEHWWEEKVREYRLTVGRMDGPTGPRKELV